MNKETPTFYAIMPAAIRYDNDLTPNAKILYAEITALTQTNGVCWASDNYFMNLYGVERQTIQRWLKSLEDKGYICREVVYKTDKKKKKKRFIRVYTEMLQGYTQNSDKGMHNIVTVNNTSINNTSTNKDIAQFDEFWSKYPNRVGKKRALASFNRLVKNESTFNAIMNDLEKRKGFEQWTNNDGKYIPHPSTYLNGEMWNDEYRSNNNNSNRQGVRNEFGNIKPKD